MLSKADTELLTRVGKGTPMGELMRRYWLPVTYTWELEPDGQPKRVRVLGEDLLAWRASDGTPAFIEPKCPHRGAELYFGRNEENGIRCAYHGWKFDVTGQCVEMPNEVAESNFKAKVKTTTYRGADYGGMTWIYMGPRQDDPPGIPEFEWGKLPAEQVDHGHKLVYECNWMQALEGELDTTHVFFLHSRLNIEDSPRYGMYLDQRGAKFHIVNTEIGLTYGAERSDEGGEGESYWRVTNFLFPMYGMFPGGPDDGTAPISMYMPIDDTHTLHFGVWWHPSKPLAHASDRPNYTLPEEPGVLGGGTGPMKPEQKGRFFADWWPEASPEMDFLMNLEAKKTRNFTGIPSVRLQDSALIWSMGPIMDRTREHLGTSDAAIIKARRMLIAAAKALAEQGVEPPGVDHPSLYGMRACQAVLPTSADWTRELDDWLHCRTTEHPSAGAMARHLENRRAGQR